MVIKPSSGAGQYEAIEATLTYKRILVVQKTGWGKSLVYFTATKLLRESGRGTTVVVSPLLSLMENQLEAADKLNLRCEAFNSLLKGERSITTEAHITYRRTNMLITKRIITRSPNSARRNTNK